MKWIIILSVIFCMSCSNSIPDQDAIINVDVQKDTSHKFCNVNCSKAYDTTLSTLNCKLSLLSNELIQDKDIYLFKENKLIKKDKTKQGDWASGWITSGIYNIQVGNKETYTCIILSNIEVKGGRGCDVKITLPKN